MSSPSRRIANDLAARVESGALKPGDRLPSEAELVAAYKVARMTARAAILELRNAGLVTVEHGRGVFVSDLAVPAAIRRLDAALTEREPQLDPDDVRLLLTHLRSL